MSKFLKQLLYVTITIFTLFLVKYILQYGMLLIVCVILLIMGSLLYVHIEAGSSREAMLSMTRKQRQLHHAKNLLFFSLIPTQSIDSGAELQFPVWNEWKWRELAERTGDRLSKEISMGHSFAKQIDEFIVRDGLPSQEDVARCDNTIVLTVRGLWAGIAARINPVLNTFLNRFVKCWNRSLIFTSIRVSAYGLPYPTVSIDFPTADVATLNFGQKDDCLVMSYMYDLIRKTYPKARIIILTVCLGGLRILNWLSRNPNPEGLAGVIVESPLPSVRHLLAGFLGTDSQELYHTFCLIVPNFRPELEEFYSFFRKLKSRGAHTKDQICRVPLFLGMIESDVFSNPKHLPLFCGRFPNLTVFTTAQEQHEGKPIVHGQLYRLPQYRYAVQTFLQAINPKKTIC